MEGPWKHDCTGECDFLTIPHNMNKGWGLFYSENTWDGNTYDEEGWRTATAARTARRDLSGQRALQSVRWVLGPQTKSVASVKY